MTEQTKTAAKTAGPSAERARAADPEGVFEALIPEIRRAIAAEGYTSPTPIQEKCIPHLLAGRDIMGTAQTGTGKTAAFALPMLQRLYADRRAPVPGSPRALILAPTRELAAQIDESIGSYGRHLRLSHAVIFGGVNQARQTTALTRGTDILTATPGRLLDLMGQGFVRLERVEIFILDEVDRMLDMGFIPDIRRVLAHLPAERQTMFFSATMPRDMVDLAGTMVRNPVRVSISPEQPTVDLVSQKVLFVDKGNKDALLVSLLNDPEVSKALVFTRMKHTANKVVRKLQVNGIQGEAIHGNKSQAARTRSLEEFRRGRCRVLVATDLAARGLDVEDVSHVINYDMPLEAETYIHRIGRTARAGATGDALSLCTSEDGASLADIERLLGEPVPAEKEHAFHSEEAFRMTRNAGGGSRGTGGGTPGSRLVFNGIRRRGRR